MRNFFCLFGHKVDMLRAKEVEYSDGTTVAIEDMGGGSSFSFTTKCKRCSVWFVDEFFVPFVFVKRIERPLRIELFELREEFEKKRGKK